MDDILESLVVLIGVMMVAAAIAVSLILINKNVVSGNNHKSHDQTVRYVERVKVCEHLEDFNQKLLCLNHV